MYLTLEAIEPITTVLAAFVKANRPIIIATFFKLKPLAKGLK